MHFELENVERIDECIRLYSDDEWVASARRVSYKGPLTIKDMYVRFFAARRDFAWIPIAIWL
jgi:hypothetical protein